MFIINFIVPLIGCILITIAIQLFVIYEGKKLLKHNFPESQFKFEFENSYPLYIIIFFTGILSSYHLYQTYSQYPFQVPSYANLIFDSEQSFISSLKYGINRRRRNIFYYKDPQVNNQYFHSYVFPLLYTAALTSSGATLETASVSICFLNTVSTVILVYYFSHQFSRNPFLSTLCFILNSSWAFLRSFFGSLSCQSDLIHDICKRAPVPWYQTLAVVLSYSKTSSFTVPLIIAIILLLQRSHDKGSFRESYIFAGVLSIFIPSTIGSIIIFAIGSCYSHSFSSFMPFSISLLFKLTHSHLKNFPIWREYQMAGVFFSPFVVIFEMFGPMFITSLFPFIPLKSMSELHSSFVFLTAFAILLFIRDGNESYENIVIITSSVLPYFCTMFINTLIYVYHKIKNSLLKGIMLSLAVVMFIMIFIGGLTSIKATENKTMKGIDEYDLSCGNWIMKNLRKKEIVLTDPISYNPIAFVAGRQMISGNMNEMWKRNVNVWDSFHVFNELKNNKNIVEIMKRIGTNWVTCLKKNELCEIANEKLGKNTIVYENEKWKIYKI